MSDSANSKPVQFTDDKLLEIISDYINNPVSTDGDFTLLLLALKAQSILDYRAYRKAFTDGSLFKPLTDGSLFKSLTDGSLFKSLTDWVSSLGESNFPPEPVPEPLAAQIDRLSGFLLTHFREEIGDDSAVDVAIRLLGKLVVNNSAGEAVNTTRVPGLEVTRSVVQDAAAAPAPGPTPIVSKTRGE
jgi:hypothetical protein